MNSITIQSHKGTKNQQHIQLQLCINQKKKLLMEKQNPLQTFIIDSNDDIGYFDRDMADTMIPTLKEIQHQQSNDLELIQEFDQEIAHSKSNFFKVEVVFEEKRQLQNKISKPENSSKPSVQSKAIKSSKSIKQEKPLKKKCKIENHILMESYLQKKYDSNIFFKWITRYSVLTSQKLYIFEDNLKKQVLACFNFKIMPSKIIKCSEENGIKISFYQECEDLILRAPNNLFKNKWMKALQNVIERNSQTKKLFMMTNQKQLYQQSDTITEDQFLKIAETGDILLFLTDHTSGKFQRFITQSEYDHVAMVIRFNGQLMVFEANQGDGVAVYKWSKFVKYFNLYKKITYRKLRCLRKKQLHTTFLSFARKNIGKKFDIGAYKLLLKQQSDFDWNEAKQRGYFCSQLIAKALKSGGLLDPVKACSRYWPVDFSKGGNMCLIGASLGDEQSIVLNKFVKNV